MAKRYAGKYSPGSDPADARGTASAERPFDGKVPSRVGLRSNLLFLLPFPFLVSAFRAEPGGLALNLGAFGALMLSAWLTREGLLAEEAYEARSIARRPAIPRKIFGAATLGLGLGLAGIADGSLLHGVIFAGLGGLLHLMSFGLDPLKDKGLAAGQRFDADRAERAVREAESVLTEMATAIKRARDAQLEGRVGARQPARPQQRSRRYFQSRKQVPSTDTAE